jgi:lysophospholipase L1-like esterase
LKLDSEPNLITLAPVAPTPQFVPPWVYISLVTNGVLLMTAGLLLITQWRSNHLIAGPPAANSSITVAALPPSASPMKSPESRQQLTYQQWVEVLAKEARVVADKKSDKLTILAGDSLSMWFPANLLPNDRTWLNQGISGETSSGLQKRLALFESTQPERIFVMIGINDLIRGASDQELINTYEQIILNLQQMHPRATIVVQSILPHGDDQMTADSRNQLLTIPNQRIHGLNQKLALLAREAGVTFLDLYPLFADSEGWLRSELTTDGLHLSAQGYLVWRSAIQVLNQLKPEKSPITPVTSSPEEKPDQSPSPNDAAPKN